MRGLESQSQQLHEAWREKEESDRGWLVREREQILREIELVRKIARKGGNDIAREKKHVLRGLLMICLCVMCT